jgi:hypothetical protein
MSQPVVNLTEVDNSLGVLPETEGQIFALIGTSSTGTVAAPATYARKKDVIADFGIGPLVEAACWYIDRYAKPVVVVRVTTATPGAMGTITNAGTGTSVVSEHSGAAPKDDYELYIKVTTGGTIGTGPIFFQWSVDGGRTLSPITALGTLNTYTLGDTGIQLDFAAGTLVTGDVITARATGPLWDTTGLGTALDAIGNWIGTWDCALVVGPCDGSAFDAVETKFAGFQAAGKPKTYFVHTRIPNAAESESTYKTALDTIFSAKSTLFGSVGAGACKVVSGVTGRQYRRPAGWVSASFAASVSEEVDIADVNLGSVPVAIRDARGNVDEHDESVNPGLDDSRFTVLRTWIDGPEGVYINRPRIMSPAGSDFYLVPHRRVMNLAERVVRAYLIRRTSVPIRVDKKTGFILEAEAREIEAGALAALGGALLAKPKASDVQFVLSRRDNLLSTKTLNSETRIIPLAYPETFNVTIGFLNPALQTIQV